MAPQIEVARVLHDNQPLGLVVKIDDWDAHADPAEKTGNRDVVAILRTILSVADEDEAAIANPHAPELPSGASLFNRGDMNRLACEF
jgi:hypothetical protein